MLRSDRIALDAEISHARLNIMERDLNNVVTFLDSSRRSRRCSGLRSSLRRAPAGTPDWMSVLLFLSVCIPRRKPFCRLRGTAGHHSRPDARAQGADWVDGKVGQHYAVLPHTHLLDVCGWTCCFFNCDCSSHLCLRQSADWSASYFLVNHRVFFFILTFVFSAKVLSEFSFVAPKLKYVVGSHLEVPGLSSSKNSRAAEKDFIPASDFLGLDPTGAKEHDAGKFSK